MHSDSAADLDWLRAAIPCQSACPAGTDIPGYLEAIFHERFDEAYEINLRDNIFPAVLGRVCSRPCETACRHGNDGNGESVAICYSKRSAADFGNSGLVVLPSLFRSTGKRVAIVGGGPAGLATARELARFGHDVTVFEKHRTPGGMLNQGIPVFRLPRRIVEHEISQIAAAGVTIRCGVAVGSDVSLEDLRRQHDAVVLAAGTFRPNIPSIDGADLNGVEHGLQFLLEVNELSRTHIGRLTTIIGGGYTALDCARTAIRLGATSHIHYRRGVEEMVVLPNEIEEFSSEGGLLDCNRSPTAFLGIGKVHGVRFVRTRGGQLGADGRRLPAAISGTEIDLDSDEVILATGQFPDTSWIDASLRADLVAADEWLASGQSTRTAVPGIFAAGDFATGATTLIGAISHAKRCARAVDAFLMGRERIKDAVALGPVRQTKVLGGCGTGRGADLNRIPIHPIPTRPPVERSFKAEVETGYSRATAIEESSRCYLCHYKFEILDEKCVLCDECLKVKPVPNCIVEVATLCDHGGAVDGYERISEGDTPSLYHSRLWIDQTKCIRCGQCEAACPVNAITIQKVSHVSCKTA